MYRTQVNAFQPVSVTLTRQGYSCPEVLAAEPAVMAAQASSWLCAMARVVQNTVVPFLSWLRCNLTACDVTFRL